MHGVSLSPWVPYTFMHGSEGFAQWHTHASRTANPTVTSPPPSRTSAQALNLSTNVSDADNDAADSGDSSPADQDLLYDDDQLKDFIVDFDDDSETDYDDFDSPAVDY
jgi:hypothetical protein